MAKIKTIRLALAIGITAALYGLFLGLVAWLFNWGTQLVEVISAYYIGYDASFLGSIIGAIWFLVDGFIAGVLISFLYNKLSK